MFLLIAVVYRFVFLCRVWQIGHKLKHKNFCWRWHSICLTSIPPINEWYIAIQLVNIESFCSNEKCSLNVNSIHWSIGFGLRLRLEMWELQRVERGRLVDRTVNAIVFFKYCTQLFVAAALTLVLTTMPYIISVTLFCL